MESPRQVFEALAQIFAEVVKSPISLPEYRESPEGIRVSPTMVRSVIANTLSRIGSVLGFHREPDKPSGFDGPNSDNDRVQFTRLAAWVATEWASGRFLQGVRAWERLRAPPSPFVRAVIPLGESLEFRVNGRPVRISAVRVPPGFVVEVLSGTNAETLQHISLRFTPAGLEVSPGSSTEPIELAPLAPPPTAKPPSESDI